MATGKTWYLLKKIVQKKIKNIYFNFTFFKDRIAIDCLINKNKSYIKISVLPTKTKSVKRTIVFDGEMFDFSNGCIILCSSE